MSMSTKKKSAPKVESSLADAPSFNKKKKSTPKPEPKKKKPVREPESDSEASSSSESEQEEQQKVSKKRKQQAETPQKTKKKKTVSPKVEEPVAKKKEKKSASKKNKKKAESEGEQEVKHSVAKSPREIVKKVRREFHAVTVDKTPRSKTILKKIEGRMNQVENPASEEEKLELHKEMMGWIEKYDHLRVAYVESGCIYHDPNLAYLIDLPKPNDLTDLVFQFNGPDGILSDIHSSGTLLHYIKASLNKERVIIGKDGVERFSKGKGWKELYVEIPLDDDPNDPDQRATKFVWKPFDAAIPFRYRPKTIPVGGAKKKKAGAQQKSGGPKSISLDDIAPELIKTRLEEDLEFRKNISGFLHEIDQQEEDEENDITIE